MAVEALPVRRAAELDASQPELRWLVSALWSDRAVGVIGGEPKCCKSFLALDIAVAVASGAPCLRRFGVAATGPVLLFAAEDALDVVRSRLDGIARAAGVDFDTLDIHVITADVVRLDLELDRERLWATVESIQPKLLVLDPFVRLHRADENAASRKWCRCSRTCDRSSATSARQCCSCTTREKTAHARAGQALRGSSEIHAWGDSYLYVRRHRDALLLSVEHRAAPSIDEMQLELHADGGAIALRVSDGNADDDVPVEDRIIELLRCAAAPMSQRKIREACRVRAATLATVLGQLVEQGVIARDATGYRAAP